MASFSEFSLNPTLTQNIVAAGFAETTPIQEKAIPVALAGRDLLGLAQTGTGKTAAFVLPMLQRLVSRGERRKVRALILAPTRELAEQIDTVVKQFAKATGVRSLTIYGGASMTRQIQGLKQGAEVIVACPGRLMDHMNRKTIDLRNVELLILDEADQMFDMGFLPGVRKIAAATPLSRQTMLFSATMPTEIGKLAAELLKNPERVELALGVRSTIAHALYPVDQAQKTDLLLHMLHSSPAHSVLVFTRTKHKAKRVADQLMKQGIKASSLQGNLSQNQRARALGGFKSGAFQVLVATDIAARGIDVKDIALIVNYDIPANGETYTHRIGRTGRAEKTGEAVTFVSGEDKKILRDIEKTLKKSIEQKTVDGFQYKNMPQIQQTAPVTQGQKKPQQSAHRDAQRNQPQRQQKRRFHQRRSDGR